MRLTKCKQREWLLAARLSKGLSQAEMADELGISLSYYSLIEAGRRQRKMDIALVHQLSEILGLPLGRTIDCELRWKAGAEAEGNV